MASQIISQILLTDYKKNSGSNIYSLGIKVLRDVRTEASITDSQVGYIELRNIRSVLGFLLSFLSLLYYYTKNKNRGQGYVFISGSFISVDFPKSPTYKSVASIVHRTGIKYWNRISAIWDYAIFYWRQQTV